MTLDLAWVRRQFPGRDIRWLESTGSTMTEASQMAAVGCGHGSLVGADEQTAGIGRHGHTWHSETGNGLYVSFVLRPTGGAALLPNLTLAIGLAAREAILEATGVECDLRWPNDLLAQPGGLKCTGILAQLEPDGSVIAGIGINVNHAHFPPELTAIATSLRIASGGQSHAREPLLVSLIRAVTRWSAALPATVLAEFARRSSFVRGRRVSVDGGTVGTTAGLDPQGFLLLRCDNGQTVRVLAGGVRPL